MYIWLNETIKNRFDSRTGYMSQNYVAETNEDAINDFTSFMDFYLEKKKDKKRNLQRLNQVKKLVLVGFGLISKKRLAEWNKLCSKEKSRINLKADHKLRFEDVNLKFIEKFREYMYTAKFTVIT